MTELAAKAKAAAKTAAGVGKEDKPKKLPPPPKSVAEYLAAQINLSGKSQSEIADECGFGRPNMITMIKLGDCKLPMSKIGPMALALNIDPLFLFKLVMNEYEPETWSMIQDLILKQPVVSRNELEMLEVIRKRAKVQNPRLRTTEEENRLLDVVNTLKTDNAVIGD